MGLLWKKNMSLFVLILLEVVLVTYVAQSVLKRRTTDSTLLTKKKGRILATVRTPDVNNLSGLREKRSFKDGRFYPSRKVYNSHNDVSLRQKENTLDHLKKVRRNLRSTNRKRGIPLQRKSKRSEIPKNFSTIANNVSVPYEYSEEITACTFSFDQRSLTEARRTLSRLTFVNLFYINLSLRDGMSTPYNLPSQKDMLFRWQYVLKTEKFLVQLPVDFDLITFYFLYADAEERVIDIKLLYKNSNCPTYIREATYSIQKLLWNELFLNSTRFYLCNRDIRNYIHWHDILYYITTIWVGYGLNCTEMNVDYGIEEIHVSKEKLPLVTPVFCFLLSLQFVWIFALLDVYMHRPPNFTEIDSSFSYAYNNRPYGAQRVLKKILYISCRCYFRSPIKRFLGLVWFCLLLPFGLYRTFAKHTLSQKFDQDYLTVIKPSEPLFMFTKSETTCLALDVIYATLCPVVFVWIGEILYHDFFNGNLMGGHLIDWCESYVCQRVINCCIRNVPQRNSAGTELQQNADTELQQFNPQQSIKNENENFILTNHRISDKFSKPFGTLSSLIHCKHSNRSQRNDERGCFAMFRTGLLHCLICPIIFISNLLFCLFPIIPFSCQAYSACKDCIDSSVQIGNRDCPTCRRNLVCCRKLVTDRNNTHCNCIFIHCKCQSNLCKILICTVFKLFWALCMFLLLYALCLRPVISTFTFIFRSFTYFVFVALPIRSKFLQYTLTVWTTLVYFIKYLSEIIDMNAHILNYVFDLTRANRPAEEIEELDENKFDFVYERLTFVTKRLYLLCLKVLIVFMYLFITIETFLQNKSTFTGASFSHLLGVLILVFGPYAASFFLKTDKGYVLSDENRDEIRQAFIAFEQMNQREVEIEIPQGDTIEVPAASSDSSV